MQSSFILFRQIPSLLLCLTTAMHNVFYDLEIIYKFKISCPTLLRHKAYPALFCLLYVAGIVTKDRFFFTVFETFNQLQQKFVIIIKMRAFSNVMVLIHGELYTSLLCSQLIVITTYLIVLINYMSLEQIYPPQMIQYFE
jgi:hypothetical protein